MADYLNTLMNVQSLRMQMVEVSKVKGISLDDNLY